MADSFWKNLQASVSNTIPSKLRMHVMRGKRSAQGECRQSAAGKEDERHPPILACCSVQSLNAKHQSSPLSRYAFEYGPEVWNDPIPDTLDLGLYYNEEREQHQVAKVLQQDRSTHCYVVGATGSGKTKFLEFLIRQDIINGCGLGVIDPHGDLTEDIKGFLAYLYSLDHDRAMIAEQVVLIDPTDQQSTVTFNPLERIGGISVAEQAAELISAFKKIWSDSWGVRMEDLMRNTLIALGEAELTLSELTPFLTRRPYRRIVLEKVANPTAIDYFERFDTLTDRSQVTWIEPVMNKINAFLADERMRQMFSASKSSFNLREIMDRRKHLLIKLDKGKLKGASDLLGSLFLAKIQMTAFSRSGIPAHQRVPFYLYIDEFQNFASDSFDVILSEARKYGLSLVMAHQSLSQIPDSLRGLILASAGLQVYFRVNRQDAQLLAKEVFRYGESGGNPRGSGNSEHGWESKIGNLQHLPPRTCYAKHKIQGGTIELQTVGIAPTWTMLRMTEEQYRVFLPTLPFGKKYLRSRHELAAEALTRQQAVTAAVTDKPLRQPVREDAVVTELLHPVEAEPAIIPVEHQPTPAPIEMVIKPVQVVVPPVKEQPAKTRSTTKSKQSPQSNPTQEREHRRLQHLIKRLTEQHGYRAIIEEPTVDGQGRVDVGLERDGRKVACEVSVTSTADQELGNIEKCLASGYARVILCAEQKSITKIRKLVEAKLTESDQQKVVFVTPEELAFHFEEEAAGRAGKEERVKGYRVKVNFQPMDEGEKATKRQTLARVFVQSTQSKDNTK